MNQVQQQVIHLILILNHQIDLSMGQLQCNAFPRVEWQVFELWNWQRIYMLSLHPKSTVRWPELKRKNLVYWAWRTWSMLCKVLILIHLPRIEAQFHLFLIFEMFLRDFFLLLNDIWISLYQIICPVDRLPYSDHNVFAIFADLNESWVRSRNLAFFFQRVIVFGAINPKVLKKIFGN